MVVFFTKSTVNPATTFFHQATAFYWNPQIAATHIFFYPSSHFLQHPQPIPCHPKFLPTLTLFFFGNPCPTNILPSAAFSRNLQQIPTTHICFIYLAAGFPQIPGPYSPPKVFTHPNPVFFWKSMPNQHSSIGSLFQKFATNTCYPHLFHLPSSWFPPNPWPILATQRFYPPQPAFLVKSPPSQHFFIGTTTILFIYPSSGFSQNLRSIPAIQSFYPSQQLFFVQNLCPTHIPPWFFPGQINPSR